LGLSLALDELEVDAQVAPSPVGKVIVRTAGTFISYLT